MANINIFAYQDLLVKLGGKGGYPYYNFLKITDNAAYEKNVSELYLLEIALAGFARKHLLITTNNNYLTVEGKVEEANISEYIYQGISRKSFKIIFKLDESMKIYGDANLEQGILRIVFERSNKNEVRLINIHDEDAKFLPDRS